MTGAPSGNLLSQVSAVITERMGLSFPEERHADLARGLKTAGQELGFDNVDAFAQWLTGRELTSRQIEMIASHLTVGETYFFRDPASFDALGRVILPSIIATRPDAGRTLRLWSAGCCTGEEAYSLAISCTRAMPVPGVRNISILGTDISAKFLAKAEAGTYTAWSFRGEPAWLRPNYFSPGPGNNFTINPDIKALVQFSYLNLADDSYPSLSNRTNAMDVIFCRNVLMYFTPDHQQRVVASLYRCLVNGGYLLVNPAEVSTALFSMFDVENIGDVIVYRKSGSPRYARWPSRDVLSQVPAVPIPEPEWVAASEPPAPVRPTSSLPPIAEPIPETALARARTYANDGRLEVALTLCQDAIAADRTSDAAHFLHATICQELGRFADAVTSLENVLYLEPDFVLAHHALGGLHKRLGRRKESARHIRIALKLLSARNRDDIVPDSDGMTCGRLIEAVRAMAEA